MQLGHDLAEGVAVEQLHGVPGQAAIDSFVENSDDARVPDAGQGKDLAAQALQHRAAGQAHGLQRDLASGLGVPGEVDHTHRTRAERLHDVVGPNRVRTFHDS